MPPNRWGVFGTSGREVYGVVNTKLQSVNTKVTVRGFVAHVSATLLYLNDSNQHLQVECSFPLDEGAAFYKFEAEIDNRKIIAQCMEKKKATKMYEEAVSLGYSAVLGSQDEWTSDILQLALGNFPAGTTAKLQLSFVMELQVKSDGGVPFVLPAILNPRYSPGDQKERHRRPKVELSTIQLDVTSAYSLSVEGEIMGGQQIASVISHSDALNVNLAEDKTNAQVTQDGSFRSDHDWSMIIYYSDPYKTHLVRETGDRAGTNIMKDDVLMVNMFPEVPEGSYSNKNEIIFIVDRSGSMAGINIESARATLLLFLKSLPPGCYFNIISFGNNHKALFSDGSKEYNEETLSSAMKLQKEMKADMGGTEVLRPLQSLYQQETKNGYARQLILLTDGQVWNVDQVLKLVARNACNTRAFAVGIGEGASTALVKGIARAGRGQAEMVVKQDNLQTKVMGMLQKMVQESVHDVRVTAELDPVSSIKLYPKVPPVIFGGSHLTLYLRLAHEAQVKKINISGHVGSRPLELSIDGSDINVVNDESLALHRLAARAQINQWQVEDEEDVSEELVLLSVSSGVLSRLTAFVGVDNEGKTCKKEPEDDCEDDYYMDASIPRDTTYKRLSNSRWETDSCDMMRSSRSLGIQSDSCITTMSAPKHSMFVTDGDDSDEDDFAYEEEEEDFDFGSHHVEVEKKDQPQSKMRRMMGNLLGVFQGAQAEKTVNKDCHTVSKSGHTGSKSGTKSYSVDNSLLSLVSLQQFDGSWNLDDLQPFLSKPVEDFREKNTTTNEKCWATALVIAILETRFGEVHQQWLLLANKACGFLSAHGVDVEKLLQQAKAAI